MPPAYLKAPNVAPQPEVAFVQGCTGKLRQSREEACRALQRRTSAFVAVRVLGEKGQTPGSAYACGVCGYWHTSHHSQYKAHRRTREYAP